MLPRWPAWYGLYALRLAALQHFYFNPPYMAANACRGTERPQLWGCGRSTAVPAVHHAGKIAAAQVIGMDEQVADTGIAPHDVFVVAVELH